VLECRVGWVDREAFEIKQAFEKEYDPVFGNLPSVPA
jgi:hypothetical protein